MIAVRWLRLVVICTVVCLSGVGSAVQAEELSLEECINIALDRNATLASSRYSLISAEQGVWESIGSWLPRFEASAGYNYSEQGGVSQYDVSVPIRRIYSKSLIVRHTLFRWGGNYFDLRNSMQTRDAREADYSQAELEIIDLVRNYYFNSLRYKGLLDVAEQTVETAEHNLELVQARFDLGSANQSELLKAKVQLLTSKASLESAKQNWAVSIAELNNSMNRPANTPITLAAGVDTLAVDETYESAVEYAKERHPRIRAARAELNSAKYSLRSVWANYLPVVSWSGSRSFSSSDVGNWTEFNQEESNWSLGVSFSWPIPFFDGFSQKAAHSRAKAGKRLAEVNLESTINSVGLGIQTALLSINNARVNLQLYEESVRSAQEDMAIAQERYNLGAATILDLLDAQQNLADAQNSFISAKYDFNLAVSALDKAMGRRR